MEPPSFLPDELRLEILSWLPVKSLVRFTCVSHSWKSTISDSQFIKLHLHRSSSTRNADFTHLRLLIDGSDEGNMPSGSVSSLYESLLAIRAANGTRFNFSGTCNGLICLRTLSEYDHGNYEHSYLFRLWNPATRSMSQHSPPLRFTNTSWYFGFGYDSSTDTYKVVVAQTQSRRSWMNVYSMGDTCWRTIQVFHFRYMIPTRDAVYVSKSLNWLVVLPVDARINRNDGRKRMKNDRYMILSFDLGKENCAQLSLPYCPRGSSTPILGVLTGCLCISQKSMEMSFMIWQMKEFGVHKSWTLLFNISGYESICRSIFSWSYFAMYMSENGDALLLSKSNYRVHQSQAVLYTQKENKLEVMDIADDIVDCYVKNYIESLVSPCLKTIVQFFSLNQGPIPSMVSELAFIHGSATTLHGFSNPISFKLNEDNYLAWNCQAQATIKGYKLLDYHIGE